jgi:hypothetical protein
MKIGILGAPGVGKTDFAFELRAELMQNQPYEYFYVLDKYVEELRYYTNLAYGEFGDFIDDLQVVFKRRELELYYPKKNTITVGTVLDSVIHNFIRTDEITDNRHTIGLQQERLKAIAATFGLLYTDTWDYDYAFVLRSDDTYGKALVDLLATYRAPVLSFNPEVPDDQKASTAAAAIRALEADKLPKADELGVRSGGEAGEEDGDSTESVPDVPEQGTAPGDA